MSQVPLKTTAGNGSATEPKVPSATLYECMGSSPGRHPVVSSVNAVLGVIHRDINCLRSSEVCSRSRNCNAGCECSRMLPALNSVASVAQSDTHSLETESTSLLGGHPSGVKGSPVASSASARSFDTRHSCQPTETHGSQLKEPSRKAEQSSAAPEMVTASRIPITPRVVVTGHSVSSPEESRLYSSSLSETAAPFAFNQHSYPTGQPSEAQIPGECRASFSRQPELLVRLDSWHPGGTTARGTAVSQSAASLRDPSPSGHVAASDVVEEHSVAFNASASESTRAMANQQGSTIAPVNRSHRIEWPLTFKLDQSRLATTLPLSYHSTTKRICVHSTT